MNCPKCGSECTYIHDSREERGMRRRRYKCHECGERFPTLEVVAEPFRPVESVTIHYKGEAKFPYWRKKICT